jgi:hypothetical protein
MRANTRWSRQRLRRLLYRRLFDYAGGLVQNGGPVHPALRLSFSVSPAVYAMLRVAR